jgi:hypothetical protein
MMKSILPSCAGAEMHVTTAGAGAKWAEMSGDDVHGVMVRSVRLDMAWKQKVAALEQARAQNLEAQTSRLQVHVARAPESKGHRAIVEFLAERVLLLCVESLVPLAHFRETHLYLQRRMVEIRFLDEMTLPGEFRFLALPLYLEVLGGRRS